MLTPQRLIERNVDVGQLVPAVIDTLNRYDVLRRHRRPGMQRLPVT